MAPSLAPCSLQPHAVRTGSTHRAVRYLGYLGSSGQPSDTPVELAPPLFSHHVRFLGVLRFSVGPNIARLRDDFACGGMEMGLPQAPGWSGQRVRLWSPLMRPEAPRP